MTAYISVSYSAKELSREALNAISETLREFKANPFIFIDNYKFELTQEREMMERAMADIERCDILIAETSHKGIGIGIEAGYAKAKGKPVVYVRRKDAEHSTTVSGISDFRVLYADTNDLRDQLREIINSLISLPGKNRHGDQTNAQN